MTDVVVGDVLVDDDEVAAPGLLGESADDLLVRLRAHRRSFRLSLPPSAQPGDEADERDRHAGGEDGPGASRPSNPPCPHAEATLLLSRGPGKLSPAIASSRAARGRRRKHADRPRAL